jgi:hypothetical protein
VNTHRLRHHFPAASDPDIQPIRMIRGKVTVRRSRVVPVYLRVSRVVSDGSSFAFGRVRWPVCHGGFCHPRTRVHRVLIAYICGLVHVQLHGHLPAHHSPLITPPPLLLHQHPQPRHRHLPPHWRMTPETANEPHHPQNRPK